MAEVVTNLSDREIVLCIAALDHAADGLTQGMEAAARLNLPMGETIPATAQGMRELRDKLMVESGAGTDVPPGRGTPGNATLK